MSDRLDHQTRLERLAALAAVQDGTAAEDAQYLAPYLSPDQRATVAVAEALFIFATRQHRWWRLRRRPRTPLEYVPAAAEVVKALKRAGAYQ